MPEPMRHHKSADDDELVQRVRAGDVTAFEGLFRMHFPVMLRFATSFVADTDAAEDIVQEVFGRVWMQRATWEPASDVLSYLLAAVRNRALNAVDTDRRRAQVTRRYIGPGEAPAMGRIGAAADVTVEQDDTSARIWSVVEGFPEQRRTVLVLRWRHGFDWTEIARVLQLSVPAVRMSYSRALHVLRRRFPSDVE